MTTLVTLKHEQTVVLVECDGLSRDTTVSGNVVMTGCRKISADGLDHVEVWSVPEDWVVSYICGRRETDSPRE
jgi:hypothetical protein